MKRLTSYFGLLMAVIALSLLFIVNFHIQFKQQRFPSLQQTMSQIFQKKATGHKALDRIVHINRDPSTFIVTESLFSPGHPLNIQQLSQSEGAMDLVDDTMALTD